MPESGVCGASGYLVLPATPARRNISSPFALMAASGVFDQD